MRFDDTLQTVLAADVSTPFGKASAWRQLIDLIGRGRAAADSRALALLASIRDDVPQPVRAASTRALEQGNPPYALVALCASDHIAVAAPLLRGARLTSGEWIELLPQLSPAGREVLRGRRDLPAGVEQALAAFTADFAIEGAAAPQAPGAIAELLERIRVRPGAAASEVAEAAEPPAAQAVGSPPGSTFVSVGAAAMSLPVVAAALREAGSAREVESGTVAEGAGEESGTFEIADVVARIDAFYTSQPDRPARTVEPPRVEGFRFESDAQGIVRWVEGVPRGPLIGLSLEMTAMPGMSGVDGAAAGAFRQRAAFDDARLVVTGESDAAGDWRISAVAAFDPATGRFAGYRGVARRPRSDEDAGAARRGGGVADSLRQLMHELRTPTNAIAGFAEMIEHQMLGEAPALYRERAAIIRDHARALLAAIDDLDIAARIEASALQLRPGEVALRPLLARIAEDLAGLCAVRGAAIDLPDEDAAITGDPRAVERLLARLLATLVSAARAGERIEVALADSDGGVAVGFSRPSALAGRSDEALFGIDDERDEAALLGTGFALRLVRNLARELSGALTIEPGQVTVRLPAAVTKSLEVVR